MYLPEKFPPYIKTEGRNTWRQLFILVTFFHVARSTYVKSRASCSRRPLPVRCVRLRAECKSGDVDGALPAWATRGFLLSASRRVPACSSRISDVYFTAGKPISRPGTTRSRANVISARVRDGNSNGNDAGARAYECINPCK